MINQYFADDMKKILSVLSIILLLPFFSNAQSSGDTINRLDSANIKQGHWIIYNKTKKLPDYTDDQMVEEGVYVNGKKEGVWRQYWNNGKVKSETTYKNNLQSGSAKIYYKNGSISEEGTWIGGKWDGSYKLYYENGNLSYEWNYVNGKREGQQKYYFENGKVLYDGSWKGGNESGVLKEYNEDGQLLAEKNYNDGKIDEGASKYYTPTAVAKTEDTKKDTTTQQQTQTVKKDENVGLFTETGYRKLMGPHGVAQDGTFDKGHLIDGKKFIYSSDGKLTKTIIYKKGEVSQVIDEK